MRIDNLTLITNDDKALNIIDLLDCLVFKESDDLVFCLIEVKVSGPW